MTEKEEEKLIQKTKDFVKVRLQNAEGGHDWFHIERVYKNALLIAEGEKVDKLVVRLAALLHDIADYKFTGGDESLGPQLAGEFLVSQKVPVEIIQHVKQIIQNVSFKGGNTIKTYHSRELEVVQDADRLDALGAIGIARTFNYGGYKNRKIYDPKMPPETNLTPRAYKASTAPTINHFYEKLLLLKDRMNTPTGKKIAQNRHDFMEKFLEQFYSEWNGER